MSEAARALGDLKRDVYAILDAQDREIAALRGALIEATAELIYLRQHGKDGAVWWANESKDVWRDKARAALEMSGGVK